MNHVCKNNCVLFRKDYANLSECPKCKSSIWKDGDAMKRIPHNVPRHFPITPRLHRLVHDATARNRSIILKFSYAHQDASMEYTSNEGKGVHLHTLVDRQRKRYHNAVDVVVRLHDPTDQVPNVRHLRVLHTFSSMTSLELRSSRVLRESFVSTTAW